MAKADRLARLDAQREELEAEYTSALIDALRATAAGRWGLFDHQADRGRREAVLPVVEHLAQLGYAIDRARDQLGLPKFSLHEEFVGARGPVSPEAMGEPKQAKAWLARLESAAPGPSVE